MEEDRGHCSHLTCGSRSFPVTETDLDRPMGSTAEGILGKSGSGGPPSLGMAPSVWGLVSQPLQRLLKSSHSATASEKHSVLRHNHRFSIHRQRMERAFQENEAHPRLGTRNLPAPLQPLQSEVLGSFRKMEREGYK